MEIKWYYSWWAFALFTILLATILLSTFIFIFPSMSLSPLTPILCGVIGFIFGFTWMTLRLKHIKAQRLKEISEEEAEIERLKAISEKREVKR